MTRYASVVCESLTRFHEKVKGKPKPTDGLPYTWSLTLDVEAAAKYVEDVNEGRMCEPAYLGGKPWPPTKAWIERTWEAEDVACNRYNTGVGPFD